MMNNVTIYHNPRCSKSRETLALVETRGIKPKVVLYLETPPDNMTIKNLLKQLDFTSARQLIRIKEALYQELNLAEASEEQLIAAMVNHPKLIERPIVISGNKARLGRPPQQILQIL